MLRNLHRRKKKLLFFIYDVIVKQNLKKSSANNYLPRGGHPCAPDTNTLHFMYNKVELLLYTVPRAGHPCAPDHPVVTTLLINLYLLRGACVTSYSIEPTCFYFLSCAG